MVLGELSTSLNTTEESICEVEQKNEIMQNSTAFMK